MKLLLFSIIILLSTTLFAQKPCDYSVNVKDSIGTYKETKSAIVHEFIFGNTSKYVFFALALTDEMPTLTIQILQKSKDFLKVNCFNKNSRIFFQLENGKVITLIASDQENCGAPIKDDLGFNNRILSGTFMFLKGTLEDLQTSAVSSMRIKFTTETKDYIFKKILVSEMDKKTYLPSNYFIDFLPCVIN
ncbi:MAG: hypothetical protein EXR18_03535 [Flavobacteriaceae bacterium]|nr:hypothetical protein [Flavobacteriaceae bacterium]